MNAIAEATRDITRFARVPEELIQENRWLVWRYEWRTNSKGVQRKTKVPYQSRRPNSKAASTYPQAWSSYADALECYQAGSVDGIGFVLGDGWAGCDLDHCIEAGVVAEWAMKIVDTLKSYTEISPSGAGLKIIMRGKLPPKGRRKGHIEMYDVGRFFTVTGQVFQ